MLPSFIPLINSWRVTDPDLRFEFGVQGVGCGVWGFVDWREGFNV